MLFSYNWLQDYIKEKLPRPEKLAEILTLHFAEVKEVEKKGRDFVLDIDVRPNRAGDCFSHWGIARECCVSLNTKYQLPNIKIKEEKDLKTKEFVKVEVKAKKACPRYTARVITDIKVAPSPKWIRERLIVCGLRPINNIVDITNYVMLETGQPLHAFDFEKISSVKSKGIKKIIVRFAKKGEPITTLDGQKFNLDKNILVISDEKGPIAIAGIKGGKRPEIDSKTRTIILESANFNQRVIREGSRALKLKTDASWRFEHGIDPNLTQIAIDRAATLIQEIAGGRVAKDLVDFYPKKIRPKQIKFNLNYVESLLGIKIPKKEIKRILKSLGFEVEDFSQDILDVKVPTLRIDVSIPEDLIEEVGRIYGYEKIPPVLPKATLVPPQRNLEIFWEEFSKDVLKEAGFSEVYNYSFISKKKAEIFDFNLRELLEIENPLSENQKYLTPSLICNLLENVKSNFRFFDEIKIFELGKIFKKEKKKVVEKRALTGLIAQKIGKNRFYELKGVIDVLLEKMGIGDFWYDQYQPTPEESKSSIWNLKKCAEIKVNHQEIGFLGEVSPKILDALKIKGEIVLFDLDFEKLQKIASEECEYRPISPYPAAVRDLAVLVPKGVLVGEVLIQIQTAGGSLVKDVDLFDIYEGEEIPEGKKNLAFHIIYQAKDRTLKAEEIEKIHQKIINALEKNAGWEVRK